MKGIYFILRKCLDDFYEYELEKLQNHCSHEELEKWNEPLPDCCDSIVFAYLLTCKKCGKMFIKDEENNKST